jgi:hypothetical protein
MPRGRDRLRPRLVARGALALLVTVVAVLAVPVLAQPARPNYLPFADFSNDDSGDAVALKRGYNDAVQRYNQGLYDYHVTLEKHDRLVDQHNRTIDPAEQKKAREEAQGLRTRLGVLRREVTAQAKAVDEAWARAAARGVSIRR